jgi:phosphate transport system substrate-binding protein
MLLGAACLALWAASVTGCSKGPSKKVSVVGSTSVQPFAEMLAAQFEKENPDIAVNVQGGGSGQGIAAVAGDIAEIGTCSRELTDEEKAKFTPHVIARDGLAIVVHPASKIKGLTREQVQGIFAGKITNWKDVGGDDHEITVVQREEGSGTREAFTHLIMGKVPTSKDALVQGSTGAVMALVKTNAYAIGYVSLGLVKGELKAVDMDGVTPTEAGVAKGEYKLWRPFLFVTKGTIKPEAQQFIDFVMSKPGQAILEKEGLVGASSVPASAPATKAP